MSVPAERMARGLMHSRHRGGMQAAANARHAALLMHHLKVALGLLPRNAPFLPLDEAVSSIYGGAGSPTNGLGPSVLDQYDPQPQVGSGGDLPVHPDALPGTNGEYVPPTPVDISHPFRAPGSIPPAADGLQDPTSFLPSVLPPGIGRTFRPHPQRGRARRVAQGLRRGQAAQRALRHF